MDELKKIIKERLAKLPEPLAMAIESVPWIEKMQEIAEAHKLSADQQESFEIETALMVLGMEEPQNYPVNLAENAELDDDTVVSIAKEVEEQIVSPILQKAERPPEVPQGPIVITQENKEEAKKELDRRHEEITKENPVDKPGVIHNNLPMVEEGEVAHDVPRPPTVESVPQAKNAPEVEAIKTVPITEIRPEKPKQMPAPDYRYPGGIDPYREPTS